MRRVVAVAAGALAALGATLRAQDAGAVLDRAAAVYDTVRTFRADFVQVIANPLVGTPDTTRGLMFEARPSRFAMRFTRPRGDRIVADGEFLWVYTPSTTPDQVIQQAIPSTGSLGPNLVGQFLDHPRERYTVRWLRADSAATGVADVLELVPRAPGAPYRAARVWVDRRTGLVVRLELDEAGAQERAIALSRLRVNVSVPAREFTFVPPAGARVVRP